LIHSLVITKADYCSSLLAGVSSQLLSRLQSVFNDTARMIYSSRRSEHITPLLCELHWLKVPLRIQFQRAYSRIGVYMALLQPTCPIVYTVSLISTHIDAYAQSTLLVLSTRRSTVGDRAFPVAVARAWNALPMTVRAASTQHCLRSASSLRLTFIAVLLTNSSAGSAYRALSLSFSSNLCTVLPQRFQCMAAPKSYSYLHYITSAVAAPLTVASSVS